VSDKDPFLARWSRRKSEARELGEAAPEAPPPPEPPQAPAGAAEAEVAQGPPPPVESLTPESDFRPFMKPEIDPGLRRQALRTLFRDPHFNIMDGLDVYIDDYSRPDPIPESWMGQLAQMARLGAYTEPPPEKAAESAREAPAHAGETLEKPYEDQGNTEPASSESSDTGSGAIGKPPVTE
jgi:hypothetical protein